MKTALAAFLLSLAATAMPAAGEEAGHSHVGHSSPGGRGKSHSRHEHGSEDAIQSFVLLDRLEVRDSDPENGFGWEVKGWIGTDLTRLWLRSEGEMVSGHAESASVEALVGRSIWTWWDLLAGLRHDLRPGGPQTFGAFGIQGLAPLRVELAATVYVREDGQSAARVKAEYELLITNRLVLQPRMEAELYGKTDAARGVGSGLSTVQAGLRLRYEITRQFAPYIGLDWERAFGKTEDLVPGDVNDMRAVAGVRAWF